MNDSSNFRALAKGVNVSNIPTMPAPVSFQTWANGELSQSQGPPMSEPLLTHIQWTRFFFNSSLAQRHDEFEQSCAAATGGNAVCSTEDYSLRDSTLFSMDSIALVASFESTFKSPLYAIIAESFFAGTFIALLIHGLFVRQVKAKAKTAAANDIALANVGKARKLEQEEEERDTEFNKHRTVFFLDPFQPKSYTDRGKSTDKLVKMQENIPTQESWDDSDFESDGEAELDEVDQVYGDIEGGIKALARNYSRPLTLPSFESINKSALGLPSPAVAFTHGDNAEQLRRYAQNNGLGPGYYSPSLAKANVGPKDNAQGSYFPKSANSWVPRARKAQILHWRARPVGLDSDPVGKLAQPVAVDSYNRRPSVMFVRQTMLQAFYNKLRELVFIKGSDTMKTSAGDARIDYLDGMRGFACLFVSLSHFLLIFYYGIADATGPKHYPHMEIWVRIILGPIIVNAGLVLGIFFVLPSRTMCMRYLLKGGIQSMADSTIRRIPRLMIPVAGACLANYFFIDIDAYKWVPRLGSRTWSVWSYWQNFDNVLVFGNAFVTLWWASPPASPALVTGYATGVLWTIPVIVQGMWTCTLSALIAHELKRPWKRFLFYGVCIACESSVCHGRERAELTLLYLLVAWYANSWDQFFMAGESTSCELTFRLCPDVSVGQASSLRILTQTYTTAKLPRSDSLSYPGRLRRHWASRRASQSASASVSACLHGFSSLLAACSNG